MVLPGARTDPRTPGGMPDSGGTGPGPMPSMPKMGPGPGPTAPGAPDPAKIEEIFTQYTSGQITREDLINQLHSFSEGQGGILGLLEGMEQQPENPGSEPIGSPGSIPPQPQPQPANVQNGQAISPGSAAVPIPSLEEPLDKRHQKISALLQGYGLGPADADQLSTLLNPHDPSDPTKGHEDQYGSGEGGGWAGSESTQTVGVNPALEGRFEEAPSPVSSAAHRAANTIDTNLEGGDFGPSATETIQTASDPDLVARAHEYNEQVKSSTTLPGYAGQYGTDVATDNVPVTSVTPVVTSTPYGSSSTSTSLGAMDDAAQANKGDKRNPNLDMQEVFEKKEAKTILPPLPNIGDLNPNGDGTVWTENGWAAPEAVTKKPVDDGSVWHSAFDPGQEGGAWGSYGVSAALQAQYGPDHDWGANEHLWVYKADPFTGEQVRWPHEGAYKQFMSDMKGAFEGSALDARDVPIIWTLNGYESVQFIGWKSTPKGRVPSFGDAKGDIEFFDVPMSPDAVAKGAPKKFYFTNKGQAMVFKQTLQLPGGNSWDIESGSILDASQKPIDFTVPPGKYRDADGILRDVIPADGTSDLPDGYEWSTDDQGLNIIIDTTTGAQVTETDDGGNYVMPAPAPAAATATATGGDIEQAGMGPTMTDLDLRGAGNFQMMDDFLQQLNLGNIGPEAASGLTGALANVVGGLEIQKSKGDIAASQRMMDVTVNALDRAAVTARADADRKLQQGAALGEIEQSLTLAAKVERNKAILEQSKISGLIPTMGNDGILVAGQEEGLASRSLTMTETEKTAQRNQNMAQLFGSWLTEDPTSAIETLEQKKFGLTKAITEAEISGKIPTGYTDAGGDTMAAKRMAWERDVAQLNATTQANLADVAQQRANNDANIASNKISAEMFIARGQLAEAVEARKDATFLAKQKLDIERTKMKLDTLASLANPATYLFAVRYGLLDQISGTLGIDFGDDVMTSAELPSMVAPGTFPSMTDFHRATPTEREIMLAEVASSGGFTTDEAVRRIMEGAPGGADIRRTSLVGVSR